MFTMFKVVLVAGLIILFIKKRSRINQILEKQIILNLKDLDLTIKELFSQD